jgi:lipoprotein NlpI
MIKNVLFIQILCSLVLYTLCAAPVFSAKPEKDPVLAVIHAMDNDAGYYDRAYAKIAKRIETEPSVEAYLERADLNSGYFGGKLALNDCDAAIERWPTSPLPHAFKAKVKLTEDDYAGALQDINLALELAPDNPDYLLERARAKIRLKDFEGAHADVLAALGKKPTSRALEIDGRLMRARVFLAQGNLGAAEDEAERVSKDLNPKWSEISLLITIYLKKKDYKSAHNITKKRVMFCFRCADRIRVFRAEKNYKRVKALATESIEAAFTPVSGVYADRADACLHLGDLEGAADDYRKELIQRSGLNIAFALHDLAVPLSLQGKYDEILTYCDHWTKLFPKVYVTPSVSAAVHMQTGNYTKAAADYNAHLIYCKNNQVSTSPTMYFFRHLAACLATGNYAPLDKESLAESKADGWDAEVGKYLTGEIDGEGLLATAKDTGGDEDKASERLCAAYYYLGVTDLLRGDKASAGKYFSQSVALKLFTWPAFLFARAELNRLKPQVASVQGI